MTTITVWLLLIFSPQSGVVVERFPNHAECSRVMHLVSSSGAAARKNLLCVQATVAQK